MKLGDRAEVKRMFSADDLAAYDALIGAVPADGTLPEPLIGGLFSYLLGVKLPGPGTNYLKQEIRYLAPAKPGQRLEARVEIIRIRPEKSLVDLHAICRTDGGKLIAEGRSLVLIADVDAVTEPDNE